MRSLPVELVNTYGIASTLSVRSWSFGAVKLVRQPTATGWEDRRGTLQDEAIFGPIRDFECACGKYRGKEHEKMICDLCGVKITTPNSRRTRFAHVELRVPEQHPFGGPTDRLQVFPVIPVHYIESIAGGRLAKAYDVLVAASTCVSHEEVRNAVNQIVETLLPIAIEAQAWNMEEAESFARGLALERLDASAAIDERCLICGYALGGLAVASCPGCGRKLKS